MSFSVTQAKAELAGMLHGTSLGNIVNINGVFNRAARQLLLDVDPQETRRIQLLSTPVFYQVYDYTPPTDLKGQKVIDIFPQVNRLPGDQFTQTYNQNFDLNKTTTSIEGFTIVQDTGVKTLRLNYLDSSQAIILNSVGDITSNGTWVASGTASNLLVNTSTIINGSNALQFDVATGTGYLTNSTMTAIDLTAHQNLSTIFFQVFKNLPANLTSATLKFGSSASDYYSTTALTTNFASNPFIQGWDMLGQAWSSFTTTGSPDITAINYIQVAFVVTAPIYGMQLAQIWSKLGQIMNIEYYSKYLFSNASGTTWQDSVDDDSNLINLDVESYNIFIYLIQKFATQQALGQDASFDSLFSDSGYQMAINRYKKMYKSEISKPQQMYYTPTNTNYNNYFGRQY